MVWHFILAYINWSYSINGNFMQHHYIVASRHVISLMHTVHFDYMSQYFVDNSINFSVYVLVYITLILVYPDNCKGGTFSNLYVLYIKLNLYSFFKTITRVLFIFICINTIVHKCNQSGTWYAIEQEGPMPSPPPPQISCKTQ